MSAALLSETQPVAQEVLRFWLGDALELGWPSKNRSALWFQGGDAVDRDIRERFGDLVQDAMDLGLDAWEHLPLDRLALVIVLDQFSRNVYRSQARAFSGDARARILVMQALDLGWDLALPLAGTVFLYMPLMHAEDLALQDECVRRFQALLLRSPPERHPQIQGNIDFAKQHRDIIARFGRFPYRNAVLGRDSTVQEQAFLREGPRFGQ